jgi:hypothetical protein
MLWAGKEKGEIFFNQAQTPLDITSKPNPNNLTIKSLHT